MKVFLIEKKGYNKKEVDDYVRITEDELKRYKDFIREKDEKISKLESKIEYYSGKENVIIKSIESAVIVSEVIKENNKKIFTDNIQKLKKLYDEWSDFLSVLKKTYPDIKTDNIMDNFKKSILDAIGEYNSETNKTQEVKKTVVSGKNTGSCDGFRHIIVRKKSPSQKIIIQDEIEQEYKKECLRLGLVDKADKSYYLKEILSKGKKFSGMKDFLIN